MSAVSTQVEEELPYCTCGGGKGFKLDERDYDEPDPAKHLWVCVGCGLPTRLYLEGWLAKMG